MTGKVQWIEYCKPRPIDEQKGPSVRRAAAVGLSAAGAAASASTELASRVVTEDAGSDRRLRGPLAQRGRGFHRGAGIPLSAGAGRGSASMIRGRATAAPARADLASKPQQPASESPVEGYLATGASAGLAAGFRAVVEAMDRPLQVDIGGPLGAGVTAGSGSAVSVGSASGQAKMAPQQLLSKKELDWINGLGFRETVDVYTVQCQLIGTLKSRCGHKQRPTKSSLQESQRKAEALGNAYWRHLLALLPDVAQALDWKPAKNPSLYWLSLLMSRIERCGHICVHRAVAAGDLNRLKILVGLKCSLNKAYQLEPTTGPLKPLTRALHLKDEETREAIVALLLKAESNGDTEQSVHAVGAGAGSAGAMGSQYYPVQAGVVQADGALIVSMPSPSAAQQPSYASEPPLFGAIQYPSYGPVSLGVAQQAAISSVATVGAGVFQQTGGFSASALTPVAVEVSPGQWNGRGLICRCRRWQRPRSALQW
jgi:hypothetical protein